MSESTNLNKVYQIIDARGALRSKNHALYIYVEKAIYELSANRQLSDNRLREICTEIATRLINDGTVFNDHRSPMQSVVKYIQKYALYSARNAKECAMLIKVAQDMNVDGQPSFRLASPAKRFFARSLDNMVMTLVWSLLFLLLWNTPVFWLYVGGEDIVWTSLVLSFLVIPAQYYLFGTTVGKSLMGLKLRDANNQKINHTAFCKREVKVQAAGLAFGIPILSWVSMAYQFYRCRKFGKTSYDGEDAAVDVGTSKIGICISILIVLTYAALVIFLIGCLYLLWRNFLALEIRPN